MTAVELLAALGLVLANGFFVASEFAIARVRPTQVDDWVAQRKPGARSVRHAVVHIDAYLAACQLGITIASLGLGVVGERAFHRLFEDLLGEGARAGGIALAGALAFAVITVLHVVVGELAPKSAAIARTGPVVLLLAPPMRAFYLVTKPVVDLFNGMGNLLLKPFGIPPASEVGHVPHTEDELRALVRESLAQGLIDPEEGQFTDNVFTFGDRRAREVMVPRPDMQFVTTDAPVEEVVDKILSTGLTRLPLCRPDGGLDATVGVIHAKDLLGAVTGRGGSELDQIARPVEHVPDSLLIDELLEQLRKRREHLALVVDEHGTTIGLVTLEDVLEEIVGEIEDEFDPDDPLPIEEEDGRFRIPGSASLRLVAEKLQLELTDVHEATIGGYVVERIGRLPDLGERVDIGGVALEVTRVGEAQIEELQSTVASEVQVADSRAGPEGN